MSHHYPKPGEAAPDFQLPEINDQKIQLSDFRGHKNVILSFHPLAFTGICSEQMKDLQNHIQELNEKETVALGISVDSVPTKKAWAESLGITDVLFLSDFEPKGAVAKKYGIYRDEGFSERAVFVINKDGIIRFSKIYPISQKPDLAEIINTL